MDFAEANRLFSADRIGELAGTSDGLRFLKLKSLSRPEHLRKLFATAGITPSATGVRAMFREAFDSRALVPSVIDKAIMEIFQQERKLRALAEPALVSELYRLQAFDWGGLHQNSLEKTIVDNYVKKIRTFDELDNKIENELHNSLRGYVLCSWYNHWTSIIIEDVFKEHRAVLPAVGLVKKIDFFINNVPYDLKVTYLPEGFVKECRRADGLRPEMTLLKRRTRQSGVHFDSTLPQARLLEDLWQKQSDHPSKESQALIKDLREYRLALLARCVSDPRGLIRWLYENQGVRRFDASNRLFLVLVDKDSFFNSWKLKRAKPLLDKGVHEYLDKVVNSPLRTIEFNWEGSHYRVISDAVFVIHP